MQNVEGAARYIVKDVRDPAKKEVPPAWFSGKLFSYSGRFFAAPLKVLMQAVVKDWREQSRKRSREHQIDSHEERMNDPENELARDVPDQSAARPPCEYIMEDRHLDGDAVDLRVEPTPAPSDVS